VRTICPEHVGIVKEVGFDAAVTTAHGAALARSDLYQLPRFGPWDKSPVKYALRMTQNLFRSPDPGLPDNAALGLPAPSQPFQYGTP